MRRLDALIAAMKTPISLLPGVKSLALLFSLMSLCGHALGDVFLSTGFEGSSSLPSGWTQSQIDTSDVLWTIRQGGVSGNPSAAHGGTNNVTLSDGDSADDKTRLISPTFSTSGFTNITLTFWHTQPVWYSDQDQLTVFYSTDGGTNWQQLAFYNSSTPNWTERTLTIPTASANTRIAFEGNAKWGYGVSLDDIEVSGIPDTWSEVSVTATDAEASEVGPDAGTWTITRTGNTTGALSVNYTLSGTATAGSDYNVSPASPVSFAAGETSKVITLTPIDDTVGAEGDEVATLTLGSGTGYAISGGPANIGIYDDEGFDINILVIGSTHSFSEGGENDVVHQKPFNPTNIAVHLREILAQDTALNQTVKVEFEDIYKFKTNTVRTSSTGIDDITAHCYSLAQHFFWPDGKAKRLANLRGEDGTKWDYIILCSDPYIMANFPGMVAEGVKLIKEEAARSNNTTPPQVVLFAQWPETNTPFSADDFNEVAHRIGSSSGLPVVPAGMAWNGYSSKDTSTNHPTPRGEYLAAAAIYSKLYDRSAATSGYDYPSELQKTVGETIANHALTVVQTTSGASQYSGTYATVTPFTMKNVFKRVYSFRETGTSTEDRLASALHRLDDVCRITFVQNQGSFWDFNYGRGNDRWEDDKDYEVNPAKYDRSYGFPMHHYYTGSAPDAAAQTMPYGIDKYSFSGVYEDGTDLGIAYNMVRPNTRETGLPEGHDVRAIPIRLLWLKMEQAWPGFAPLGDNTHMGPYLNDASVAFMYTLMTGRCPIVDEPASPGSAAWMQWLGHKVGYETAWQMSHLTTRSPGFQVMPSSVAATTVTTTAGETMTVRFLNPPQQDVTVNVSSSHPAFASVSPGSLTFTPENYNIAQQVTVSGIAAEQGLQDFNVVFSTDSSDEIFDNLSDSWGYTSNTDSVSYGQTVLLAGFDGTNTLNTTSNAAGVFKQLTDPHKSATSWANVNASISTSDAVVGGLQWTGMTSPSTWGSATFTPNATNTSNLVFAADNEATVSFLIQNTGTNDVTLETLHFRLQRDNATGGSPSQITISLASGDLSASGPGVQTLSTSNGAFNYDFDLGSILTDATLAPGQSATFTFHAVPSDPLGANRRIRVDNMAISGQVTNDYITWAQGHSLNGQPTDDDDLDGLSNDFERLFGLDPTDPNSRNPISVAMDPATGQFSYTRRTQSLTGKTYKVWYSTNLNNWFEDTSAQQSAGVPTNGVETVAVTLHSSLLLEDRLFITVSTENPGP